MEQTDALLMDRWRTQRDTDAFAELVQRHWSTVFSCCRRVLGDPAQAEEVAQECFIELMHSPDRIRLSLGGWLHTMSVRRSLDKMKSEKRRRLREKTYAGGASQTSENNPAADEIVAKVDEAIAQLPKAAHAALIARYFEGLSYAEVGRRLGVSETAARNRVNAAIEEVRHSLKRLGVIGGTAAIVAALEAPAEAVPTATLTKIIELAMASPAPVAGVAALISGSGVKLAIALTAAMVVGVAWLQFRPAPHQVATESAKTTVQPASRTQPPFASLQTEDLTARGKVPEKDPLASQSVPGQSITGRVHDISTREAIEGVTITAKNGSASFSGVSAADGTYTITLPPGEYQVMPEPAPGYPLQTFSSGITVFSGESATGVDFPLVSGMPVSGVVVDITGRPVRGAEVAGKAATEEAFYIIPTDAQGKFMLNKPRGSGAIIIQARSEDSSSEIYNVDAHTDGGIDGLRIVLDQPRTASVAGVVVDGAGKPLANAPIHLYDLQKPDLFSRERSSTTDNAGRFTLSKCAAGQYSILVCPNGDPRVIYSDQEYGRLKLEVGQHVEGFEVIYGERGGLEISGHVVDPTGQPVAGADLHFSANQKYHTEQTDPSGAFRVTGLDEGDYRVTVQHNSYSRNELKLAAGTVDTVIQLKAMAKITGTVADAQSGKPVTAFYVTYCSMKTDMLDSSLYSYPHEVNNEDGVFELSATDEGDHTVVVWAKGLARQLQHLVVQQDKENTVHFELQPAREVNGFVLDRQGKPVANALLLVGDCILFEDIQQEAVTRTDATGAFTIDSLPDEVATISAYQSGYGVGKAQAGAEMKIVLPDAATILGHMAVEGIDSREFRIALFYPDEPSFPRRDLLPDAQGNFKISDLAPGKAMLNIWYPKNGIEQPLDVKAGEAISVDFPAPLGNASVAGRLTRNGEPFKEASLTLTTQLDGFNFVAITTTGEDGTFTFEQVWPGKADLAVGHCDKTTGKVSAYEYQVELLEGQTPLDLEINEHQAP